MRSTTIWYSDRDSNTIILIILVLLVSQTVITIVNFAALVERTYSQNLCQLLSLSLLIIFLIVILHKLA